MSFCRVFASQSRRHQSFLSVSNRSMRAAQIGNPHGQPAGCDDHQQARGVCHRIEHMEPSKLSFLSVCRRGGSRSNRTAGAGSGVLHNPNSEVYPCLAAAFAAATCVSIASLPDWLIMALEKLTAKSTAIE